MNNINFDQVAYLKDLEYIVNIDSGSRSPGGIARVAEFFQEKYTAMGWQTRLIDVNEGAGPCLEVRNTTQEQFDVLLIGHMDTVFGEGIATSRPFAVKEGRAYGPGIYDMKAGLLLGYYALKSLSHSSAPQPAVCVAMNSDEEIGSRYSREWFKALARKSRQVFVLEPGGPDGALINERKGIAAYNITFSGVAAHAGENPDKGCSAIAELGHWIVALHQLGDPAAQTTVNVGVVSGGTVSNVIAAQALADVDVRIRSEAEMQRIDAAIAQLEARPVTPGVTVSVFKRGMRPPMNQSAVTGQLCRKIESIGADLGIPIHWRLSGGGSDANHTAALGIPSIDGLGAVGAGAHSLNEYIELNCLETRFKLLRAIIAQC